MIFFDPRVKEKPKMVETKKKYFLECKRAATYHGDPDKVYFCFDSYNELEEYLSMRPGIKDKVYEVEITSIWTPEITQRSAIVNLKKAL